MTKSLLTAIIFTYNHVDSIAKCIESIVNQKTDYKYEIHICDDASIDGTTDVCKKYAEKYPDKIKLFAQPKNTFYGPYERMQAYKAMQRIKTKYWCMIDGDDYWCDENKIQIALDFLEENSDYVGWAHDTLQVNKYDNTSLSYVHDLLKINPKTKISLNAEAPFLLISSRIFKNINFAVKKRLPIDYQLFWYHLSKGPIFYYDKIMAVYNITDKSTWASNPDLNLVLLFSFKLAQLFNFQQDELCTLMLKNKFIEFNKNIKKFNNLVALKKLLGIKLGWYLWIIIYFVPKYGFECLGKNYIYSNRKKTKKESDLISQISDEISLKNSVLHFAQNAKKYKIRFMVVLIFLSISLILNLILLFLLKGWL